MLSIKQGNSEVILVSAHHDCEGNPIQKEEQVSQIKNAMSVIKSWELTATIIGVWVNEDLKVEVIQ